MPILKKFSRLFLYGACAQTMLNTGMVFLACTAQDYPQRERLSKTRCYALHRRVLLPFANSLTLPEKDCVDAFTSLLQFKLETDVMSKFSPFVLLNDVLFCLNTRSELEDAWWLLSNFYEGTEPMILEVRRDVDDMGGVVLHVSYETAATLRFVKWQYVFLSHATLILENLEQRKLRCSEVVVRTADNIEDAPRIVGVEHRWFHGPIVSRVTDTYPNVIGDVGDLVRRFNGFFLSAILTKSEFLHG